MTSVTKYTLVAAHLSPLYPPSQATPLVISTKQTNAPLPNLTADTDIPLEHATHSQIFDSPSTGSILMRLIHGGLILELIPLTRKANTLRLVFPDVILPYPSLTVWDNQELHVIAVTSIGSLFRVVLPLIDGELLWHNISAPRKWWREYVVMKLQGGSTSRCLVQVQGCDCVAISLPDGSLLRLDVRMLDNDTEDDQWDETVHHHSSFLNSLTSFLQSEVPGASDIVSLAALPHPTDIGHTWSLSRDRTLRLWTSAGYVGVKNLAASSGSHAPTSSNGQKTPALLPDISQRLLRAFIRDDTKTPYVVAFIPSESAVSAGTFHIVSTTNDNLEVSETVNCPTNSVHSHLQDFIVKDGVLHTLWDRQGQSLVQWINILVDPRKGVPEWTTATYSNEVELTPAYLDELLLSPGSLTDRYFEAIMRPGMFSDLTLRLALAQYTDACLSLPGEQPPQLYTSYTSLGENIAAIVGCTVQLTKDPRSGAPQYEQYWSALKRDWEGFIARCRELERSARWPLAIGFSDLMSDPLVIERERIASVVETEQTLHFPPRFIVITRSSTLAFGWNPLEAALQSRSEVYGNPGGESHRDGTSGHRLCLCGDSQDAAGKLSLTEHLDEGFDEWINGRLQTIEDIQNEARVVLNLIGGLDKQVKAEEEEASESLLLSPILEWRRALVSSYATTCVHARYDHCVALITLLIFLAPNLDEWDPNLLAEILVVFRGIAILRYTSRQPAGTPSPDPGSEEEVIASLRNMNFSSTVPQYAPSVSLFHRLIEHDNSPKGIPGAAHAFLDNTGLLQSLSPAYATSSETAFGERLRRLGYHEAARDCLEWLPSTPGVRYVLARLWIDEGRYDDAAYAMQRIAGAFGVRDGLSAEDQYALQSVLSGGFYDSSFHFYHHVASLFKAAGVTMHEVTFSQLSLSVAPPEVNTNSLWYSVVRGFTDLGLYQDAYATLIASPYDKLKRECIGQLVYRMCEENAVDRLMTFNFSGLTTEVEEALSFKVRNADPRVRPFYSRILYAWYISRGDYRNASSVMYQRARKLASLVDSPADFIALAELQLEAYVVSINALSLIDPGSAWFVMTVVSEHDRESRKRRKLSVHIPESRYSHGKKDAEIVQLSDIHYEHALLSAQVELVQRDPQFLPGGGLSLPPSSVILKLAQKGRFNTTLAMARTLEVDMSDVFAHLTNQCIRLSRDPEAVIGEDTSDWLLTDKVSSWAGSYPDRGWRYLRQALEKYDGPQSDFSYSKTVLDTLLAFDRSSSPPPWLVQSLQEHHPEFLIRSYLRYDLLDLAVEQVLSLMRKSDTQLINEKPRGKYATWLPYTLIDQILAATEPQDSLPISTRASVQDLRTEIANRLTRIQKLAEDEQ
ncbi:hypothetical protein QCA50_001233 [Cerrena zonata]|uniref:Nuclear pore complex protein Nup160 n=1 Tax=Cerrena zonata TaxID=2478898 RepID=A0AAW0GYU5_9APHY